MTRGVNTVIIGQGIAGTTLAWCLWSRGISFVVVDHAEDVTASRIAAGLITPITGQRLVKTWRYDQFWPRARQFYQQVASVTGNQVLHEQPIVRLFRDADERRRFEPKQSCFGDLVCSPNPDLELETFRVGAGAFEMPTAARLDVRRYLDVSRQFFRTQGCLLTEIIDVGRDIVLKRPSNEQQKSGSEDLTSQTTAVSLPRIGLAASRLIFCQGVDGIRNPWFDAVRFLPAKGEILTLEIPKMNERRTINRHVWLAPAGENLARAGSTYDWENLNTVPTHDGRQQILCQLREFVNLPVKVVAHHAAVRPALHDARPRIGLHPLFPQLGFFNGLGSKGALQAPWLAEHLAGFLAGEHELDPEVDVARSVEFS